MVGRERDGHCLALARTRGQLGQCASFPMYSVLCKPFIPQLGTVVRTLLEAPQPAPLERVLTLLTNDILEHSTGDFALVLDDYHVIEADTIHRGMGFLLEHLPPQMHLIMATRADPPLPLARLRARGQLIEVRAADLRFDANEGGGFLHTVMGLDLSAPDIAALERRTEGWIAGLQMAALSLEED